MPPLAKVMGFESVVLFGTILLVPYLLSHPVVTISLGVGSLAAAVILKLLKKQ